MALGGLAREVLSGAVPRATLGTLAIMIGGVPSSTACRAASTASAGDRRGAAGRVDGVDERAVEVEGETELAETDDVVAYLDQPDFAKFWDMMRNRPGSLRAPLTAEQPGVGAAWGDAFRLVGAPASIDDRLCLRVCFVNFRTIARDVHGDHQAMWIDPTNGQRMLFGYDQGAIVSLDAGQTWTHLGLEDTRNIAKVRVHPEDPDTAYVAALESSVLFW